MSNKYWWQKFAPLPILTFSILLLLMWRNEALPQAVEENVSRYSGIEFLSTLVEGARAKALGGAFTGVADDISAITKNSSGLMQVFEKQINCIYSSIYNGMANFGSVSLMLIPKNVSRIGISWTYFVVPNIPDTRDVLYTDTEGRTGSNPDEFNPQIHDIIIYDPQLYSSIYDNVFAANAFYLCYVYQMRHSIFTGVNTRYVHLRLLDVTGSTLGVDWTCMYKSSNLRLGVALKNLLSTNIKWQSESGHEDKVPLELSVGASYIFDKLPIKLFSKGVVACEIEFKSVIGVSFGGELWLKDIIALRCGIKQFSNISNYGIGSGIKLRESWVINSLLVATLVQVVKTF